jgi:medium-chain acyl-[acyl-carrier-protein] hydrolase
VTAATSLVSFLRRNAGEYLLFCFHHAGGGASLFRNWPHLLGPAIQVATVQLPGREASFGESPLTDFDLAVERISTEIKSWADRPYALFGHSLGAILAFEIACRFERGGARPPDCLIFSGHPPPQLSDAMSASNETGAHAMQPASSKLPDEEFLDLLRRYGGTPREILDNSEMLNVFLPILRADFSLAEGYRMRKGTRVACPILVLGGRQDSLAKADELPRWGELTNSGVTVRLFDGGHFFIRSHEAEVCDMIADFLQPHMTWGRRTSRSGTI